MHSNNACCLFGVLFELFHMSPRPSPAHLAALVHSIVCVCVCVCVCSYVRTFQAAYVLLVGTFPFNSFLAALFCCVGSAVLTCTYCTTITFSHCVCARRWMFISVCAVSLTHTHSHTHTLSLFTFVSTRTHIHPVSFRMQIDPSSTDFKDMLIERCFAEYMICNFILFIATINYIG